MKIEARPPSEDEIECLPIPNYPPNSEPMKYDGRYITGGCGLFYIHPDRPDVVTKVAKPIDSCIADLEIEKRVYRRLGKHPHLAKVVAMDEYGIHLKLASHGCLRLYYREGGKATLRRESSVVPQRRYRCRYIHRKDVRHGDLSGRNLLLDSTRNVLLCDFSGSYIDGESATIFAEVGFRHPDESEYRLPTIRAELHSLGSLLYEIVMYVKPYEGLEEDITLKCVARRDYPDVSDVPLGCVIIGCWTGAFASAAEVADAIAQAGMYQVPVLSKPRPTQRADLLLLPRCEISQ